MKEAMSEDGKTHIITLEEGDQVKLIGPGEGTSYVFVEYKDDGLTTNCRLSLTK